MTLHFKGKNFKLPQYYVEPIKTEILKLSRKDLEGVIECLRIIDTEGPPIPIFGICLNLECLLNERRYARIDAMDIVVFFAQKWKYHSGDKTYPVAKYENEKWKGKFGGLRRSLIRHIIAEINKHIKKYAKD